MDMWIELTTRKVIRGTPRQAGFRCEYPWRAANALISNGEARGVNGPYEGRDGEGYPVGTQGPETMDPDDDPAVKLEDEDEEKEEVQEAKADSQKDSAEEEKRDEPSGTDSDDSEESEDEQSDMEFEQTTPEEFFDAEPEKLVEDLDIESIDGVGPSLSEKVEDAFTLVSDLNVEDLTDINGISETRAEKIMELVE